MTEFFESYVLRIRLKCWVDLSENFVCTSGSDTAIWQSQSQWNTKQLL